MTLLFAFLIGLFAGLRSLTPPAAVAWAVYLGWLKLAPPLSLIGSLPAVIILSVLAITEVVFDKLPNTPNRTAPPGLIARIVTGGFTSACVALGGGQSAYVGAALGVVGGIVGCFAGYQARTRLVKSLRQPDFNVAMIEDLIAIGGSLFVVSRF
ncbi:MAG TPA: DUF4126 family protein [Pyrinomonadaceae bacterium]|nr:DUF4126 family protein [Pyrinomonadaceae bacterium]